MPSDLLTDEDVGVSWEAPKSDVLSDSDVGVTWGEPEKEKAPEKGLLRTYGEALLKAPITTPSEKVKTAKELLGRTFPKASNIINPLLEGAETGLSFSPTRMAGTVEKGLEGAATLATGQPQEIDPAFKISPTLEKWTKAVQENIPQVATTKETPIAGQVGAGVLNAAAELAGFFLTPDGISMLGLAGAPKAAQQRISTLMAAQMAQAYPDQVGAAIDAAKKGDYAGATKQLVATPVMAAFLTKATSDAVPKLKMPEPMSPEAKADLIARNQFAPGTLRPQEQQAFVPPAPEPPPELGLKATGPVFTRRGAFAGEPVVPKFTDIIPNPGMVKIEGAPEKMTLETRGKVSFGAEAPTLLRNAVEIPEEVRQTIEENAKTLPKAAAQAAINAVDEARQNHEAMQGVSYREPKPAPSAEEVARREARAVPEEDLTIPEVPPEVAPPEVGQYPPEGMPTGTLSKLQRSRLQAGKTGVRVMEKNNPPGEVQNAEGVRENAGQPGTPGQVGEGSEANRGGDIQQAPPGQPEPLEPGARSGTERAQEVVLSEPLKKAQAVSKMTGEEFPQASRAMEGGQTSESRRIGLAVKTPEEVGQLRDMMQQAQAEVAAAREKFRSAPAGPEKMAAMEEMGRVALKPQFFREAIEAATGTGGIGEALRKENPNYQPPVEHGSAIGNAARVAAQALRDVLKTPVTRAELGSFGVVPKVINAAVEVAARAIEAGASAADAIAEAIDHIRANHKGYFDEAGFTASLRAKLPKTAPVEPAKPAEAGKAVTPADPTPTVESASTRVSPGDAVRSVLQNVRDYLTIDPIPKLSRAMGGGIEAIQHAYARAAVPRMINAMLAKVFPEQYHDPEAMARTMDVLKKDDILGGYDDFLAKAADAAKRGDTREANKWQKMADSVGSAQDLAALAKDVEAAKRDPTIVANIDRWKQNVVPFLDQLYNEMKGVDPETEREGRGRVFGARVNLLAKSEEGKWMKALGDDDAPQPSPSSSNYRNPNAKRDRFDRLAKLTGDYSNNPAAILANVLSGRWNEVTKIRLFNKLVESGAAASEKPIGGMINGEEAKPLPIKMPETSKEGSTRQVEKTLWVAKSLVPEIRGVLDTDLRLKSGPIAKVLTQLQLLQLADATSHLKNLHSVIAGAQGMKSTMADVARKMPGLSTADTAVRLAKIVSEIRSDTPEIRAELDEMARNGMLREKYPSTGIQKITKMQDVIHAVDTAARVAMNRFYDNLIERGMAKDDIIARRKFVQQVGEYNRRLMSAGMQAASRSGMSPFIVAGRNFNRFGRRMLTGATGYEPASQQAAIAGRLVNLTTLTAILTLPMMFNQVLTGSIWGRRGTKLGEIDLGKKEDEKGNHTTLDLAQLYGLRRGVRSTGIDSIVEGVRQGQNADDILGHALHDVSSTAMHPWLGPAPAFAFSALTGQRLDLRGGPTPTEARKVGDRYSLSQVAENTRVALKNQNQLLYSPLRPLVGDTDKSFGADLASDFLRSPASAIGLTQRKSPALAKAQELFDARQLTPEQAAKSKEKRRVAAELYKGNATPLAESSLSRRDVRDVQRRADNLLEATVFKLPARDAIKVWRLATPQEREPMTPMLIRKLKASKSLTPEEREKWMLEIQQ